MAIQIRACKQCFGVFRVCYGNPEVYLTVIGDVYLSGWGFNLCL